MRTHHLAPITLIAVFVSAVACEGKKEDTATAALSAASPTPPQPVAEPTPEPEPAEAEKATRPSTIETELTDAKRSKVEGAIADAKGFIAASEIEEKLKADKKIDQKEAAVAAFDKAAKDKWVLFTGPITNLTENGFDLGITYTPQLPEDRMGMSRQWFPITFSNVEGYDMGKLKPGQVVVVLARYDGKQAAGKGHELVELGHW